jgi:phosphoenolpyruvate carboxykinase (GTP)
MKNYIDLIKAKCNQKNYEKIASLNNPKVINFIGEYVELCNPSSIFVRTDSKEDAEYIKQKALEQKEETSLATEGHTIHFDGPGDPARDKENTKFLITKDLNLGAGINATERDKGLEEIQDLLKNSMQGKEMFVLFLCLGPINSDFSIYAVQITDSTYVCHSEDILYRPSYEVFKTNGSDIEFFKYVHSAGEQENNVSKNIDKRRIYIDVLENIVYSVNTQYAGNTVGLKKLSLRLAIRKSDKEGWLSEHMFLMGVNGPKNRKTYFTGAFPSACGKTSTCMVKGNTIVGDDIAYLRKKDKKIMAVNVERGIFGIIRDVKADDDPLIWEILTTPGDVIFSNILIKDGIPYWQNDGRTPPNEGINISGKWHKGKINEDGEQIPFAHPNARYTIKLEGLKNCDPELENPNGVEVKGIIYGGRDSDTWPPVFQSFDWNHGVITMGASLESETTSATLGQEGVRKFNLMANVDFLSIPIRKYIENHLNFTKDIDKVPVIFGVNYFQRDKDGKDMTGMHDKRIWLKWMELKVHNEVEAIKTPIGFIPKYEDLKKLFKDILDKDYTEADYKEQFKIKPKENIAKIDRIIEIYKTKIKNAPDILFEILEKQKKRLEEIKS